MKRLTQTLAFCLLTVFTAVAQKNYVSEVWVSDLGNGKYKNPVLYADYSDPDACRVGDDFYMTSSSFNCLPGLQILHSKDLVNWTIIGAAVPYALTPIETPERPEHGNRVWAPSIRHHNGEFYIFWGDPDQGAFMVKAKDPQGPWTEPVLVKPGKGIIDTCPLWDEDGKVYLVHAYAGSRAGLKSVITICELNKEATKAITPSRIIFDGHEAHQTCEGPKFYKRNGYYYIFHPAGGVPTGWQVVLRSKNVYGPYEWRTVLAQGDSPVNGPHQGAWVDTPDGQDWFLHFQDVGNAGRIVHLQPMHWENDWPVIGVNEVDGCGEPVLRYKKPEVGETYPIDAPEDSDFFEGENLGLQWQWNANYKKEWYDLENGQLILHAQAADPKTQLCDISNLLLQKWPAPEFSITTCLHLEEMKDGDVAGLVSLGGCYTALAVQKINGKMSLQQRTGNWTKDDEVRTGLGDWNSDVIYIQMKVEKENYRTFYVGTAEENLQPVGQMVEATPGRWVGVKDGLFAINEQGMEGGLVAADYFVYQEL